MGVIMVYKPTYNWGAPSCIDLSQFTWNMMEHKGNKHHSSNCEKVTAPSFATVQGLLQNVGRSIWGPLV